MTPAEHESRIDLFEHWMLTADTPEQRRAYGRAFVLAIRERNASRSLEELARIERARGLR